MNWKEEQAKHYSNIRNDSMYRMHEKMADMEAQLAPSLSEPDIEEPQPIVQQRIYMSLDKKALELQGRIVNLETKSHTHTDKKSSKYTIAN